MKQRQPKFSVSKFVMWLIDRAKNEQRPQESVANDLAYYITESTRYNWVRKCNGKTKTQMEKMGYMYNDEWFE